VTDPAATDRDPRGRPGVVLAIVCSAQLILAVDITIILVADVQIKEALGFGEASLSWIVTAYALTFGGLLLLAGRLCDSFGHRRVFLVGMAAFGLASACAAVSADPLQLVLSRAAQGVAASMVSPAALALLGDEFTDGPRRSRAFGFWAASGSAGGVIGYTVGGVLVGYLGWRWAFIINLPITAVGIAAGRRYLPVRAATASRRRLPVLGAASVTVGLGLLIYALGQGQSAGWASGTTLALLTGAALSSAVFVTHEVRSADPLVARAVIARRESAATVAAALQAATISAAVYLGSLYLQQVLGDSPQRVGIATLPVPLGVAGLRSARSRWPRWPPPTPARRCAARWPASTAWASRARGADPAAWHRRSRTGEPGRGGRGRPRPGHPSGAGGGRRGVAGLSCAACRARARR
jgi:MFS family permease